MNFNEFRKTGILEIDLAEAIEYCRENNVSSLEFDKDTYVFNEEYVKETVCCISNHGSNGFKKAAFLLTDMKDFTIDGNGSTFFMNGIICGFIIEKCENITLKNFSVDSGVKFTASGVVTESEKDYFIAELNINEPYFIGDGRLFFGLPNGKHSRVKGLIECNAERKRFREDAADCWFQNGYTARFEETEKGRFKITEFPRKPYVGNTVIVKSGFGARLAPGVFIKDTKNIKIENYTVYGCMGMGVIAQKCENITVDGMTTTYKDDLCFSASADATHFVACRGLIEVKNSCFEAQLDDCLNVHGIYNEIIDKGDNYIVVRYVHHEAKGIDIYERGTIIEVADKESLIPYATFEVTEVATPNQDCTILYLDKSTDIIKIGDVTEDITRCPDVIFENNKASFNRARGMLLASRGKTVIRNNWFNTPGTAILFESNGTFWYESGSTKDVLIENNVFEDCCHTEWGNSVIKVCKRQKQEAGKFYHKNIIVKNNVFKACDCELYEIYDTENFVFEGNIVE